LIALDTNILVYAHRKDSGWHAVAAPLLAKTAEEAAAWAIPWPCLHEFVGIVTRPRVFDPATTLGERVDQIAAWRASPSLALIAETPGHWETLERLMMAGQIVGPKIREARIAAICLDHGVSELWSADRDFSRFPALKVRNPLMQSRSAAAGKAQRSRLSRPKVFVAGPFPCNAGPGSPVKRRSLAANRLPAPQRGR
jgi:hypothetical protein